MSFMLQIWMKLMVLMLLMMSNLTIMTMMMILMMIRPGEGGTFCWLASRPAGPVGRAPPPGDPPGGATTETTTTETTTATTTNIPTPTTPHAPAPRDEISRSGHQPPHSDIFLSCIKIILDLKKKRLSINFYIFWQVQINFLTKFRKYQILLKIQSKQ